MSMMLARWTRTSTKQGLEAGAWRQLEARAAAAWTEPEARVLAAASLALAAMDRREPEARPGMMGDRQTAP
jgi:hypothetical protein